MLYLTAQSRGHRSPKKVPKKIGRVARVGGGGTRLGRGKIPRPVPVWKKVQLCRKHQMPTRHCLWHSVSNSGSATSGAGLRTDGGWDVSCRTAGDSFETRGEMQKKTKEIDFLHATFNDKKEKHLDALPPKNVASQKIGQHLKPGAWFYNCTFGRRKLYMLPCGWTSPDQEINPREKE